MTDEADLTEFLDGDDGGTAPGAEADGADGEPVGDPEAGTVTDQAEVDPARTTSAWGADGACEACGAAARRRWRDGERLVCADCKSW